LANTANTTAGTAIPKNTVTAAGDLIYASGSATVTRLGIGTAAQLLSVGTAGIPEWTTPTAIGTANTTGTYGVTTLTDSTSSTSTTTAATPASVKSAYDLAAGKVASVAGTGAISSTGGTAPVISVADATTLVKGAVQLEDSTSSTSTTTAAVPNSVKSAYDLANTANTTAGTAIPKATATAAGDILYASGSATITRLGIGTAAQVLSVSAGGVPEWTTPVAAVGTATTAGVYGVTTLTDSTSSTSTTTAAVPNSVKTTYDLAGSKAKVTVGTAQPSTPNTGDVWVDTAGTATAINAVPLAAFTSTGSILYGGGVGTASTLAIGTADQQLVVSGGVPAWATNPSITKATLTTAGDIIYASGSATPARLGIGTAGQVLGIAAGVPSWTTPSSGGGMTIIGTATPSAATTISFTSIPNSYKHLLLVWHGVYQSATGQGFYVRLNNDSGTVYQVNGICTSGATVSDLSNPNSAGFGDAATSLAGVIAATETANTDLTKTSKGFMVIYRYTDTGNRLVEWSQTSYRAATSTYIWNNLNGIYAPSAGSAIDRVDFIRSSTQTVTGTVYLYGVS
jgi:hypothetical protein